MYKISIKLLIILFIAGCSARVEKISEKPEVTSQKTIFDHNKEKAQEIFIEGALLDMEGKYAEAILEYQDALRIDPQASIYYALGKDYLRINKFPPALTNTKKAVQLENDNVEYLTLLATIYSVSRNTDSAKVVLNRILDLDSNNINAYYSLAQLYEAEMPLKSLEIYKKLLELTGPEWSVLIRIAELNERLGNVEETIRTIEELFELNPSNLELQKLLIESYLKTGNHKKSLELVEEALEIFPDDLNLIELKGNALIQEGLWKEGAEEYQKIIKKEEIPFKTKLSIGTAFLGESMRDSLVIPYAKDILQIIDEDTSDWQIKAYLAELALKENNDSIAVFYLKESSSLASWNTDIWLRLGQVLFENSNYTEAAVEMEKAIEKFPDNFGINFILGLSLAQNNDHKGAVGYLNKAVELNPNDLNANLAYSFSLNQLKDNDKALIYLERALKVDPKNIQALGMMGLIYDAKEMFNKSDSIYAAAVSIDSTDILILNNFAYSLAERGVELDKALKMVQIAVEKDPENSSYLDTIGWVHYRLGNYKDAQTYINKAIELDPSNVTLLDHLGDVYYKMDNKEKAIELWENALQMDSTKIEIKLKIEEGLK